MQAETRTLVHLFQLDVRYEIPLYQRPYVWTQDRQWAPLWNDIATVADHIVMEGASNQSPSHFLGALVIHQQENPPGTPQRFMVIDGQQRLTTLQLLLDAAARTADALGSPANGQLLRRLILNDPLLAKEEERLKVWPTNANREAFRNVMMAEDLSQTRDDPENQIHEAHEFFSQQIREWATEGDPTEEELQQRLSGLRITLTDLLKAVAIRLDGSDSPQVIFETLNARGTPLIALDLLKNAVFLTAAQEGSNTDRLYFEHWEPELDQDYWREERRQGRLFTKNGDLFLMHWLVLELLRPIPATEIFDTFRVDILGRPETPPMRELIPRICADAEVMRSFDNQPTGSQEKRFFDLLDLLDTSTFLPIVLFLFRSNAISKDQRRECLAIIESFLVRRMLGGFTTKAYNRIVASLAGNLRDHAQPEVALHAALASESSPSSVWPDDAEAISAIKTKSMYGHRRQDRLVMVLWRVEERLREIDGKTEQGLAVAERLTLEHVIPQSWEEHWPLDETVEHPLEWRQEHLHLLGNLTLTNGLLNSSLSHGPWHEPEAVKDKRRGLVDHSLLKLNQTLAAEHPERFDEEAVDRRGLELAKEIVQVWPGPNSPQWRGGGSLA